MKCNYRTMCMKYTKRGRFGIWHNYWWDHIHCSSLVRSWSHTHKIHSHNTHLRICCTCRNWCISRRWTSRGSRCCWWLGSRSTDNSSSSSLGKAYSYLYTISKMLLCIPGTGTCTTCIISRSCQHRSQSGSFVHKSRWVSCSSNLGHIGCSY